MAMRKPTKEEIKTSFRQACAMLNEGRKPLTLMEFAAGLQVIRESDPNMTLEGMAKFVNRDVRFVRRVLTIAGRMKSDH